MFNPTDKTNLKRSDRYIALSNLITVKIHGKINISTINLKYQLQHGMMNLNYLMVHILDIILSISLEKCFHQCKYLKTETKIELHLKLRLGIVLNFQELKQ